ncbi:MAG: thioredoxin [Bacteroidaceae bacterium]|nr:thioredoxin [Bacteroidaceae bacterium]
MKKILASLVLLFAVITTSYAQNQSEEPAVIQMNKQMFLDKVFDYTSGATEWNYKGEKPAVIDFYATWCGPCRMVAPILKDLAKEYGDSIVIYKVDTDREKDLSGAMGIQSLPTIVFIPKSGQPQVIIGAADKATFRRAIDEVLLNKK